MIRRIGEMLRLQAQGIALLVDMSRFAGDRAVEKISRVELHAWFGCGDIEGPAAGGILDACGAHETGLAAVQHEVMVVPGAVPQLLVVRADARPDRSRLAEIERRARDRGK